MNQSDNLAFVALFGKAYLKCFGQTLDSPLSETESKLFCNHILDLTGLSIGWKSVKNYSAFIINPNTTKPENPSIATLDTLARYVLGAPYTNEIKRKDDEGHYPYWFLYKEHFNKTVKKTSSLKRWITGVFVFAGGVIVIILLLMYFYHIRKGPTEFSDAFNSVSTQTLQANGWILKNEDRTYWNKRAERPGALTLYTLKGDNWPDPANKPGIKNLLTRALPYDCFTAEVHLTDFVPKQEWQQAGLILSEDSTLNSKSIRLSIAFNDFFGGYTGSKEILVQAITSLGSGFGKPEEIAHTPVLFMDSLVHHAVLIRNLKNAALRIEKTGKKFRFLYSGGITANTAFKEITSQEFDMTPKYIGIFAIRGFKDSSSAIPAHFNFFRIAANNCKQ